MPGILEDIADRMHRLEGSVGSLADEVRAANEKPDYPLTHAEEIWADGALTVREAMKFLGIGQSKLFELMKSGELVSAMDGRRVIAKRGAIRYLLAHQEAKTNERSR